MTPANPNRPPLRDGHTTKIEALVASELFQPLYKFKPQMDATYAKARAIARVYGNLRLTWRDCVELTPKFWELHMDNIMAREPSAFTSSLLTIQYNLVLGTFKLAIRRGTTGFASPSGEHCAILCLLSSRTRSHVLYS
ncbi:hypothetical protein K439DRAFT_1158767 [Ramaria rubella]|nr:hypothetical protein K439DRAFT_1158767 [Ramaria rubella]